jgi:hypothetical protein
MCENGAVHGCTGRKLFHTFSTLPPSMAVVAAGAWMRRSGACTWMYWSKIVPYIYVQEVRYVASAGCARATSTLPPSMAVVAAGAGRHTGMY